MKNTIEQGRLKSIPLEDDQMSISIDVIFKKGKTLSSASHAFIKLISQEIGEAGGSTMVQEE